MVGVGEVLGHVLRRPASLIPEIIVHLKHGPVVDLGHGNLETQRRGSQVQRGVLLYLEGILQPLRYEVLMFDFEVVQQGLVLRRENLCGSYDSVGIFSRWFTAFGLLFFSARYPRLAATKSVLFH